MSPSSDPPPSADLGDKKINFFLEPVLLDEGLQYKKLF